MPRKNVTHINTMDVPDYLGSFVLSHKMAKAINQYWRVRGVEAGAYVEKGSIGKDMPAVYFVRSKLSFSFPKAATPHAR